MFGAPKRLIEKREKQLPLAGLSLDNSTENAHICPL